MEVSLVRKRVQAAIAEARQDAQRRRQAASDAQRAYTTFLENVAAPLARQVANALKAEGLNFTVFTPGDGVKLASDRGRDDFIELSLDTESDRPQVIGRISRSRGSRTLAEERPIKPGVAPDALTEEEVLDFLVWGLAPWLER